MQAVVSFVFLTLAITNCHPKKAYRILGNIEDPQNEIAISVASVLNKNLSDTIIVSPGIGSLANIDSLVAGKADLAIVDNYSSYSQAVSSVMCIRANTAHPSQD